MLDPFSENRCKIIIKIGHVNTSIGCFFEKQSRNYDLEKLKRIVQRKINKKIFILKVTNEPISIVEPWSVALVG